MALDLTNSKAAYGFDPTYGYGLEDLLKVGSPETPSDFQEFWEARYENCLNQISSLKTSKHLEPEHGFEISILDIGVGNGETISAWLLTPQTAQVERAFVISHGYGGREAPDFHLPFENAALLFPCARGISLSANDKTPSDANQHVIHGIESRESYIHGDCVEDIWYSVSALERLFPQTKYRVGFLGISFGGGIGVMATAWDPRIKAAHFNVPSFGNNPLRNTLPTLGSGAAVQLYWKRQPDLVSSTLAYFDAASAAKFIRCPTHFACALFDPMVAPPGQFSIYNSAQGEKSLFVLEAGHHEYPNIDYENEKLIKELSAFFHRV